MRLSIVDTVRCFAVGLLLAACSPSSSTNQAVGEAENSETKLVKNEEFPLILYGVPNVKEDINRAKELGFNHIYRSGNGFAGDPDDPTRMEDIQTYLDGAKEEGIKVAFCLDGHRRIPKGELGIEQMRKIINRFKGHPAIGFFYFYDEPNLPSHKTKQAMLRARLQESDGGAEANVVKEVVRPPELLLPAYEMVKKEAPNIPVIVMMAIASDDAWWVNAWESFHSTYDIVSFDTYPVFEKAFPEASLDRVTLWMDRYTKGTDKPVMPCLQIFSWKSLPVRVERAKAAGNTQTDHWRYPNAEELRYWNFSSLIQGAPGLIYYTYGGPDLSRRPPDAWLDGTLKSATFEVKRFTALTQGAAFKRIPLAAPILAATWETADGKFLVFANGSSAKQSLADNAVLSLLAGGKLSAWGFSRANGLEFDEGRIAGINLDPWEVQVWQIR